MDLHTNILIKGGDHMFKQLISKVPFNRFCSVKAGKCLSVKRGPQWRFNQHSMFAGD